MVEIPINTAIENPISNASRHQPGALVNIPNAIPGFSSGLAATGGGGIAGAGLSAKLLAGAAAKLAAVIVAASIGTVALAPDHGKLLRAFEILNDVAHEERAGRPTPKGSGAGRYLKPMRSGGQ